MTLTLSPVDNKNMEASHGWAIVWADWVDVRQAVTLVVVALQVAFPELLYFEPEPKRRAARLPGEKGWGTGGSNLGGDLVRHTQGAAPVGRAVQEAVSVGFGDTNRGSPHPKHSLEGLQGRAGRERR